MLQRSAVLSIVLNCVVPEFIDEKLSSLSHGRLNFLLNDTKITSIHCMLLTLLTTRTVKV